MFDEVIILTALQRFRLSEPAKEEHEIESYHECLYFIYRCRNNLRIDLSFLWRPSAEFIFFHNADAEPTVKNVKRKLGLRKWYSVISAAQLFENFNAPTQHLHFGAFTDCLYRVQRGNEQTEPGTKLPGNSCYIIVTDIDDYYLEDDFKRVQRLLHKDNLKWYFDYYLLEMEIDASTVNFVFTCRKIPKMLACRLYNLVFEPELAPREFYFLLDTMAKLVSAKWEIATINCGVEVAKAVQTIMSQTDFDIPTIERVKRLQTEIRCRYPNWRVCWYKTKQMHSTDKSDSQIGHFTVPCVIYKRGANGYFWYLAFYAPLEWSCKIMDSLYYGCGEDSDVVERRLDDIDTNNYNNSNNSFNYVEQDLNSKLSFPVSLFFHQTPAGVHNHAILAKHRKAYLSINVNLTYMCDKLFQTAVKMMNEENNEPVLTMLHAIRQVLKKHGFDNDGKAVPSYDVVPSTIATVYTAIKQMLRGIDENKHTNKKYDVIYCSRNTVVGFKDATIVEIGPVKIVVVVKKDSS